MWQRLSDVTEDMPRSNQKSRFATYSVRMSDRLPLDADEMFHHDSDDLCQLHDSEDEDEEGGRSAGGGGGVGHQFSVVQTINTQTCMNYRCCYISINVFLLIVWLTSLIAFIVVITLIVLPYTKAAHFQKSTCTVTHATQHLSESTCSCGKGCNSRYPCMLVQVKYKDNKHIYRNATIYDSEVLLDKECSFYPPCKTSHSENVKTVRHYRHLFGTPGRTYPCLYNPQDFNEVIHVRHFRLGQVIHGLIWSSFFLITSGLLLCLLIKKRIRC